MINYRYDILKILLKYGLNVNQPDSGGNTALHLASWLTQDKTVKLLIENGADVNAQNRLLETPLHRAAEIGSGSIFEILLKAGANIEMKDKVKRDPIDWARIQKQEAIFEACARCNVKGFAEPPQPQGNLTLSETTDSSSSFSLGLRSSSSMFLPVKGLDDTKNSLVHQSITEEPEI